MPHDIIAPLPRRPTLQDAIRVARRLPEPERLRRLAAASQRLRAGHDIAVDRFVIRLLTGCASGPCWRRSPGAAFGGPYTR